MSEPESDQTTKPKPLDSIFVKITKLDKFLEYKLDNVMMRILNIGRYAFIALMLMYLFLCLMSLGYKMVDFTLTQGALDFQSIKMLLTDGLFTLIVLAIVKTLFIRNGFDYAITFLEISFVVLVRKLILLETHPSETMLLLVLGLTSSAFFMLIVYIHAKKRQWLKEEDNNPAQGEIAGSKVPF